MNLVIPRIFIGNADDARMAVMGGFDGYDALTHVLNVASDLEIPRTRNRPIIVKSGFSDGNATTAGEIAEAVSVLATLHGRGETVLVHCHEGKSRSAIVVSVFLARLMNLPLEQAILSVAKARPIVYPHAALILQARTLLP